MSKSLSQHSLSVIKGDLVVGNLPKTNPNDVLIYNKKITEKKLKEISNSDSKEILEITKTISEWGYALGISVIAEDLVVLNKFIRENFPNLNVFDLKVCVRLVSSDSDLLETDAEHYGKLTLVYVSKILKAYERYRSTVCFGVREKVVQIQESNKPKITIEERLVNFKQLLINAKEAVDKDDFFDDTGEVVYNFIKHNKLMPITKGNLDQELIDKAMEYGQKEFIVAVSDSKRGNLKKMINDVSFSSLKKEDIVRRGARRYVAIKWIKDIDLKEILKKINHEMLLY